MGCCAGVGVAAIPVVVVIDGASGASSHTLCAVVGEIGTYAGEVVAKGD